MDPVHPRCDDETDKDPFECQRQPRIGVMKKNRSEKDCLPQPKLENASPDEQDLHRTVRDRQGELTEMKSQSR